MFLLLVGFVVLLDITEYVFLLFLVCEVVEDYQVEQIFQARLVRRRPSTPIKFLPKEDKT